MVYMAVVLSEKMKLAKLIRKRRCLRFGSIHFDWGGYWPLFGLFRLFFIFRFIFFFSTCVVLDLSKRRRS